MHGNIKYTFGTVKCHCILGLMCLLITSVPANVGKKIIIYLNRLNVVCKFVLHAFDVNYTIINVMTRQINDFYTVVVWLLYICHIPGNFRKIFDKQW